MKLSLLILMIVGQVLSPWLCCCAPTQLFSDLIKQPTQSTTKQQSSDEPHCPHCKAAQEKQQPTPNTPQAPQPKPCPCGGLVIEAAPVLLQQSLDVVEQASQVELIQESAWLVPVAPMTVANNLLRPGPHLSAESKLFSHHVLRC